MAFFVTLASGSSGNCALLSDGTTNILIDAGISARSIARGLAAFGLKPDDISAVLITHEHGDHVRGLPVFARKTGVPVYAAEPTLRALAGVPEEQFCPVKPTVYFEAGGFSVLPFLTPHDSAMSVGYRIETSTASLSAVTDLGHVPDTVMTAVMGSDIVLFEANHDLDMLRFGRYPAFLKRRISCGTGHLSNADCAAALAGMLLTGAKRFILGHLSEENNRPELAFAAVSEALCAAGGVQGGDFTLDVSPAYNLGRMIEF